MDAWKAYARAISPGWRKMRTGFEEYDFNNDVLPVVNNVLLNGDARLRQTICRRDHKLASNIERLFENGVETDVILCLGLRHGAG